MTGFQLTSDQLDLRTTAAKVATDLYEPHAMAWDQERTEFPNEERRRLGELGYLGISLPE